MHNPLPQFCGTNINNFEYKGQNDIDNQKIVIIIRIYEARDDKSNTKSLKLEKIKSSRLLLPTASMKRLS
jgi:hypothetical protein